MATAAHDTTLKENLRQLCELQQKLLGSPPLWLPRSPVLCTMFLRFYHLRLFTTVLVAICCTLRSLPASPSGSPRSQRKALRKESERLNLEIHALQHNDETRPVAATLSDQQNTAKRASEYQPSAVCVDADGWICVTSLFLRDSPFSESEEPEFAPPVLHLSPPASCDDLRKAGVQTEGERSVGSACLSSPSVCTPTPRKSFGCRIGRVPRRSKLFSMHG